MALDNNSHVNSGLVIEHLIGSLRDKTNPPVNFRRRFSYSVVGMNPTGFNPNCFDFGILIMRHE
jgi:hypothetical protein